MCYDCGSDGEDSIELFVVHANEGDCRNVTFELRVIRSHCSELLNRFDANMKSCTCLNI